MDVKEAAQMSREYVADLFGDEGISEVRLEEVVIDDGTGDWCITIGFDRPWENTRGSLGERLGLRGERAYKVVRMNQDRRVKSVTDRVLPPVRR